MLGRIDHFDPQTQSGVISYQGEQFDFHLDQWTSEAEPKTGDDVDFDHEEGNVTDVGLVGAYLSGIQPVKSQKLAGILGLVFGAIGLHRIYLGFWGLGIAQAVITVVTGGFGVVWGFCEGVLIITGHITKDAKGRPLK
jgi:hypothetical protein